ncbi:MULTISPECIES: pyrimidine/purine nucleoside phosphorylase [Psychrobacter]|uniref:pyrimidine/purine nucleoside phosphorylase n=1 Tax=Psychrobacter TaxID=497 RepID=UPI00146ACFD1|nr:MULTISPECIES: pyrimidine/purine nucleoside phosphorylase [Psychrobacter]
MPSINQYFDQKVTSIAFQTKTLSATVGVMEVGEYEFGTSEFETMTVVSGALTVKLPASNDWQTFETGQMFTVDANQKFGVKVDVETAYLCTYGKE